MEAVRGPASALFGGNALHGAINTVTASGADGWGGSLEAGPYDYLQARFGGGSENWRVDALSTSTGGYRDDTGYGQQKATFGARAARAGWAVTTTATVTLLNQETGGYVLGFNAYDSAAKTLQPQSGSVSGRVVGAGGKCLASRSGQPRDARDHAVFAPLVNGVPATLSARSTAGEKRANKRRRAR